MRAATRATNVKDKKEEAEDAVAQSTPQKVLAVSSSHLRPVSGLYIVKPSAMSAAASPLRLEDQLLVMRARPQDIG